MNNMINIALVLGTLLITQVDASYSNTSRKASRIELVENTPFISWDNYVSEYFERSMSTTTKVCRDMASYSLDYKYYKQLALDMAENNADIRWLDSKIRHNGERLKRVQERIRRNLLIAEYTFDFVEKPYDLVLLAMLGQTKTECSVILKFKE